MNPIIFYATLLFIIGVAALGLYRIIVRKKGIATAPKKEVESIFDFDLEDEDESDTTTTTETEEVTAPNVEPAAPVAPEEAIPKEPAKTEVDNDKKPNAAKKVARPVQKRKNTGTQGKMGSGRRKRDTSK